MNDAKLKNDTGSENIDYSKYFDIENISDLPSEITNDITKTKNHKKMYLSTLRLIDLLGLQDGLTVHQFRAAYWRLYGEVRALTRIISNLHTLRRRGIIYKAGKLYFLVKKDSL